MTVLAMLRQSPRWLTALVAFAALAVTTVALVPHVEGPGDDLDCLVCKAGHEPLTELSVELLEEPPTERTATHYVLPVELDDTVVHGPATPRAPPA